MDKELENKMKHCDCQVNRKAPPDAPLHPREWPQELWEILHLDFSEPFMGPMLLVVVDALRNGLRLTFATKPSVKQQ